MSATASTATTTAAAKLLTSRLENVGITTLNNPRALHALSQDMIDGLDHILKEWTSSQSSVRTILIRSAPGTKRPAFCAGGDVKTLYHVGKQQQQQQHQSNATTTTSSTNSRRKPESYFYSEYQVNHAIATCPIPIVSLWDGIVMGGGAGISVHGQFRVATEHSLLAMPECAIGLFPDVGSMWWMTRLLTRPVANWLALTGHRLYANDLVLTGLATHYIPSQNLEKLQTALVDATATKTTTTIPIPKIGTSCKDDNYAVVAQVLDSFHEQVVMDDSFLAKHQTVIDHTFAADSVESIIANLEQEGSEFSQTTLTTLQKQSPTSLKLTLEGLNRATTLQTVGEDLQMEYRMAKTCVTGQGSDDFYEGVRAALIDKDFSPKWNPERLEDVSKELIDKYFAPLSDDEEWVIPNVSTASRL
ncbi:enoyl-CoA hydratase [Nitzschia inconspicua]|uniref:Enoyl-CoA hydratase n=1 Tax=Nitzschia inconspicua TaxID=303405 RepID=A0A9K3PDP6_9STRA|nr:enoyl-CoA hydratase [Nitzschia inconspicua]